MLTPHEREQVTLALRQWAQRGARYTDGRVPRISLLTPNGMVAAVEEDTSDGQAILEILEHDVRREGLYAGHSSEAPVGLSLTRHVWAPSPS